ncbi:periplasmic heavy metal sensor [Vitreimonas flagellata]|uniref:periplasmic heavy metal sensor n=1 Tax=Vitreimonas flagellata TaxID=2560861 RepID=UPI00107550DB|nr:periplasmic heavy metal sensor [Vitreimonas flagellata]
MSEQRFPWRTLLFVSVAVNLLVIGGIAGALASGVRVQRNDPEAIVARMPGPRAFMAALPAETRVKLRAELVDSWVETRQARIEAREARRAAFAAAAEEPFDGVRVKAAFARLRAADQAAIGVFHDNMIDAFAELSPDERAAALDALRNAAPATRQSITDDDDATPRPALSPETRERVQELQNMSPEERRERFRDRIRERREERRQQQNATP